MQTIINIQILTSLRLLRKVKFLLTTQGICHHRGQMNGSLEQLTSWIKKKREKKNEDDEGTKTTEIWLYFFFSKVGNLG